MNKAKESDAFVEVGSKLFAENAQADESNNRVVNPLDSGHCDKFERRKSLLNRIKSFGPAIYKRLKIERLSTESVEAAVFALDHKVDLINEVNTDAPPNGVKQLTLLMCIKNFDINLVFTEDGSFIDYEKVQVFYNQYYDN